MTAHLLLLCHAATSSTRDGSFPDNEPVDAQGLVQLAELRGQLRHVDRCLTSPARRAAQTAAGLGLAARADPALADWDLGDWRGRSLESVHAADPGALALWLRDPAAAPHGGESVLTLLDRTGVWLDGQRETRGVTLAITHAAVLRAAVVRALDAEARSFWRIDVAPLTVVRLSGHAERWNLVSLGALAAGT